MHLLPTSCKYNSIHIPSASLPAVLAWGVAFACKLGLWHFAAGANVISGIIIGAGIGCRLGGSPAVIAVSIVAASTLIGLACGLIYIWIKVPSIIATVGCMLVLESISALAWGGGGITVSKDYVVFNSIVVVIICTVISFVIAYILYARTKYGFHLKAVSNNINVSEQQGIDFNFITGSLSLLITQKIKSATATAALLNWPEMPSATMPNLIS